MAGGGGGKDVPSNGKTKKDEKVRTLRLTIWGGGRIRGDDPPISFLVSDLRRG